MSLVSNISKKLHNKTFEAAKQVVDSLLEQNPPDDLKAAYAESLAAHPGNPANNGKSAAASVDGEPQSNGEAGTRVWEEVIHVGNKLTREEIRGKLDAKEITFDEAADLLALSSQDDIVVYCTSKTGWICVRIGKSVTALHPERWASILPHGAAILAVMEPHAEETKHALEHRTAPVTKRSFARK